MKNIPNQEDQEHIEEYIRYNHSRTYLGLKAAKLYNYAVGDVIIKNVVEEEYDDYKEEWTGRFTMEPVTISHNNRSPKKYKVVAIDEFGVPWIRQINSSTGKEGDKLESLADFDTDNIRFTPDVAQADAVLIGDEGSYDPLEQAKLKRKQVSVVRRENKKKAFTSDSNSEWGTKFKSLKRGQEVWFKSNKKWMGSAGTYFSSKESVEECKIRVISVSTITTLKDLAANDKIDHTERHNAETMVRNKQEVVVVKYVGKDYSGNWNAAKDAEYITNALPNSEERYYSNIRDMILYTEEPSYDETK